SSVLLVVVEGGVVVGFHVEFDHAVGELEESEGVPVGHVGGGECAEAGSVGVVDVGDEDPSGAEAAEGGLDGLVDGFVFVHQVSHSRSGRGCPQSMHDRLVSTPAMLDSRMVWCGQCVVPVQSGVSMGLAYMADHSSRGAVCRSAGLAGSGVSRCTP